MQNRKTSITLNLENNEQLNREIDEVIRSRVIAATRSECDVAIDEIARNEAKRILIDRISKLNTDENIENLVKQVIRIHLTQAYGNRAIREAVVSVIDSDEYKRKINKLIENAVSYYCDKYVKETIGGIVPANVITAVVNAMVQSGKEGETK